jgi:hypothetical protein
MPLPTLCDAAVTAIATHMERICGKDEPKLSLCKWEEGDYAAEGCWAHHNPASKACPCIHKDQVPSFPPLVSSFYTGTITAGTGIACCSSTGLSFIPFLVVCPFALSSRLVCWDCIPLQEERYAAYLSAHTGTVGRAGGSFDGLAPDLVRGILLALHERQQLRLRWYLMLLHAELKVVDLSGLGYGTHCAYPRVLDLARRVGGGTDSTHALA